MSCHAMQCHLVLCSVSGPTCHMRCGLTQWHAVLCAVLCAAGPDLAGLLSVAVLSAAATLILTAKAAAAWTPAQPAISAPPAAAAGGYRLTSGPAAPVLLSLSFLAAAGPLALTRFDPVNFGARMALPVGFAWSLMGFVAARVYLQQQQKKGGKPGWPSPVLAGAVAAKLGVAWHASIMGWGYRDALSLYYVGDVSSATQPCTALHRTAAAGLYLKLAEMHTTCFVIVCGMFLRSTRHHLHHRCW
jgi:hypothetical protein